MKDNKDHFHMIFWFIVGLCAFGGFLTIFLILKLPAKDSVRIADTSMIFWLSTAVSGGIGYLIGNSVSKQTKDIAPGTTTADITASITTEGNNSTEAKN